MVHRSTLALYDFPFKTEQLHNKRVWASVVFGQSSLGCKGNGICRVDMVNPRNVFGAMDEQLDDQSNVCVWNTATFFSTPEGQLGLRLDTRKTLGSVIKGHFEGSHFIVGEAFDLPDWLAIKLNTPLRTIKAGKYRIIRADSTLSVIF